MDLKSTYNKIAKEWTKDHEGQAWWTEGVNEYVSLLKPGFSILDVGCGSGLKSKYLIEKGFKVTGIDFSEEMIKLCNENVPAGKFFVKDIAQPLELNTVSDGVFAQAILLHIPKKKISGVLANILEPLKTGGYLYVAVKEQPANKPDEEILKENDYGYKYERFFSYFTLDELKNILNRNGMQVVYEKITPFENKNWIQVIAKK